MKSMHDFNIPLDDYEFEELDSFILTLENEHAVHSVSELDGLVTAIVSGPETIMPSEWLPLVFGDAGDAPMAESAEEFERIVKLVMRHLNATAETLLDEPESYEPCFMENTVKGKTFLMVDDWCIGFMKGVMLREEAWSGTGDDMVELMAPIPLFTSDQGWDLLDQLADNHVEYLQKQVAPAARAIHAYWLNQRENVLKPKGYSVH